MYTVKTGDYFTTVLGYIVNVTSLCSCKYGMSWFEDTTVKRVT